MMTRRFFIGGAASLGAFAGCRFFAGRGFRAAGVPNLRFGVISDVHVNLFVTPDESAVTCDVLKHALEWFRDQGVDAVMITGDMADNGIVDQLQAVADTWNAVFPDGRAPDGRSVEKLFVYGNHDWEGFNYGDRVKRRFPDAAEFNRHVLRQDYGKSWEQAFDEAYAPIYRKVVKGYTFVGQHWDGQGWGKNCRFDRIRPFMAEHGREVDPARPFFYFQHPHPKDTCYGPWAWGHDTGVVTEVLSSYPNAVAFSGHSHYSLTDERTVWQGAFTSIGAGSLCYTGLPFHSRPPAGFENTEATGECAAELDAAKVMEQFVPWRCRQGMLVSVFDDCLVIRRREFCDDLSLGPDWVLPLPTAESRPFAFADRAKKAVAPQFSSDAMVTLSRRKAKTRKTPGHDSVEKDAVLLEFPAALAAVGARPFEYEVAAFSASGEKAVFHVLAEGFNRSLAHKRAQVRSSCRIAVDRLPVGTVRFEVTPLDSWRNRGRSLCCEYKGEERNEGKEMS